MIISFMNIPYLNEYGIEFLCGNTFLSNGWSRALRAATERRSGGGVGLGDGLAAKRTFVGRSPRPCERAELAEPRPKTGGFFPLL